MGRWLHRGTHKRVKQNREAADGDQVNPAAIPPRPLGQLLVERGVLTATQLEQALDEQQRNGTSLTEIIIERGFAEPHMLETVLAGESGMAPTSGDVAWQANNVIAFANTARGGQSPANPLQDFGGNKPLADGRNEDAEWRRKLFDLAEDPSDKSAGSPRERPRPPRGIRGKLARNLEAYLARTAAELDERGEALQRQSIALEQELQRVAGAEAALDQRALRLRELDLAGKETATQIDELLGLIAERDVRLEELSNDRDDVRQELELVQAELARAHAESAERDRLLSSSEKEAAELVEEVEAMKAAQQIAEGNLAQRDEMLAKLEAANEAQISDLAAVRSALAQAKAESSERDRLLFSSELKAAAFAEEVDRMRAGLQMVEGNLAQRDEMLARLEAANEAQLGDLAAARSALDERTARTSELEREVEETKAALSTTQRKLQHAQHENAELTSSDERRQRELANRDASVGDLQAKLEQELGRQQEYEDRLDRLNSQLVERDQRLSQLLERLDHHERELQRLRSDEGEREAALARAVAELAERQGLLLASDKRVAALAEQLEAVRATLRTADGSAGRNDVAAERETAHYATAQLGEETTHLCFVPLAGSYTLVERSGPLPKPGDQISDREYDGRRFVVSRVGRSPLPLDERMCAYLQPLA
jgi:hypothetical protein